MSTSTKKMQDILQETDVFRGLTKDELDLLVTLCGRESHPAGLALSQQGDDIEKLYIVEEGLVQFRLQIGPVRYWAVHSSSAGDCFGWAALLGPPYQWVSEARCVKDTTLVTIDAPRLRALFESHPRVGYMVMSGIGRLATHRLVKCRQQVAMLAEQDFWHDKAT